MRVKSAILALIGLFFFMLSMFVMFELTGSGDEITKIDLSVFVLFFSISQLFIFEARVTDIQYEKDKLIKNLLSEAIEQLNHDKSEYINHQDERVPQPNTHS